MQINGYTLHVLLPLFRRGTIDRYIVVGLHEAHGRVVTAEIGDLEATSWQAPEYFRAENYPEGPQRALATAIVRAYLRASLHLLNWEQVIEDLSPSTSS
jgi:hypothetical protein